MKSINQQYKDSGTVKPFKEWLNEQVVTGSMDNEKESEMIYNNADGEKKPSLLIYGIDIKYILLGAILIGGGIYIYKKYRKQE
jgi:hypothetical protein